jgi:hypothetical protein
MFFIFVSIDANSQHTKDSGCIITDDEKDQVGSTITIRISGADKNLAGGPHFVSVVSAGAKPDRSALTEVELKVCSRWCVV